MSNLTNQVIGFIMFTCAEILNFDIAALVHDYGG
jgi:hypothetical protein